MVTDGVEVGADVPPVAPLELRPDPLPRYDVPPVAPLLEPPADERDGERVVVVRAPGGDCLRGDVDVVVAAGGALWDDPAGAPWSPPEPPQPASAAAASTALRSGTYGFGRTVSTRAG